MSEPDFGEHAPLHLTGGGVNVFRFSNGTVGVTAHKCALHLKPDEAQALLDMLARCLDTGKPE